MAIQYLSKIHPKKLKGVALVRLDFNTEDDWRLVAAIPTLQFLLRRASKVIIVSHKGRPPALMSRRGRPLFPKNGNGPAVGELKKYSLRKDALDLQKLLKKRVHFIPHLDFKKIRQEISDAPNKSIFLLENLRFMKGEGENSRAFARELASIADFYVNDAFAVSHRPNASIVAITSFLPSYAGLELEREITSLSLAMKSPKHPLVLIIGGGKASDKLGILKYFKNKADSILLGGAAANTILSLKGVDVGKSLIEKDPKEQKKLRGVLGFRNLFLPVDFKIRNGAILDIGEKTSKFFSGVIARAKTIIWSGPMGLIEKKPYDKGNILVARAVVSNKHAFSLTGGGETVMFLKKNKLDKKISFISTGGGAMLEFLEGKKLPGIAALEKSKK